MTSVNSGVPKIGVKAVKVASSDNVKTKEGLEAWLKTVADLRVGTDLAGVTYGEGYNSGYEGLRYGCQFLNKEAPQNEKTLNEVLTDQALVVVGTRGDQLLISVDVTNPDVRTALERADVFARRQRELPTGDIFHEPTAMRFYEDFIEQYRDGEGAKDLTNPQNSKILDEIEFYPDFHDSHASLNRTLIVPSNKYGLKRQEGTLEWIFDKLREKNEALVPIGWIAQDGLTYLTDCVVYALPEQRPGGGGFRSSMSADVREYNRKVWDESQQQSSDRHIAADNGW